MKKLLALLLCLLMCFSLMFGMTACGDDKDDKDDKSSSSVKDDKDDKDDEDDEDEDDGKKKSDKELIVGEWKAEMSFESMGFESEYDPNADMDDVVENPMVLFDMSKLSMVINAEFTSEGKMVISTNTDKLLKDYEKVIDDGISDFAEKYVDEAIEELGEDALEGMTKKEAVKEVENAIEELLYNEGLLDLDDLEELAEETTGYYEFIDGKLYFSDDGDFDDFDESDAIEYSVSSKKLTISSEDIEITFTRK